MNWETAEFWAKMLVLPVAFLAAAGGVVFGSVYLSVGRPGQRLIGAGILAAALLTWMVGLWWAFGRPRHWFPPGENTDYRPGR